MNVKNTNQKVCSFFGHRKIKLNKEILKEKTEKVIKELIINYEVRTFLFGGHSEFDELCQTIVSELKIDYPNIKKISYTCRNESCHLESKKDYLKKIYSFLDEQHNILCFVDEEFEYKNKYISGKANYVERNQAMIDDSDYCVFYYDEQYKPQMRKHSKTAITFYQPKSGTKLAYDYAKQKKKILINVNKL